MHETIAGLNAPVGAGTIGDFEMKAKWTSPVIEREAR
jgi:hypothetical protein